MYAPFFGLTQEPFAIAPDPRYLYMSERHREALAHLLYGLGGGGGFVLLTGAIVMKKAEVSYTEALRRLRKADDSIRKALGEDLEPTLKKLLKQT